MSDSNSSDVRLDRMHRMMNTVLLVLVLDSALRSPSTTMNWMGFDWMYALLAAFVLLAAVYGFILIEWIELPEKVKEVMGDV